MTNNITNLKNLVSNLRNKLAEGDKFFTAQLATRLTKAAKSFPQDQTIIMMASFLVNRANKNGGTLITRAELRDVYRRLYTNNTACGSFLESELGKKADAPERKPINPEPLSNLYEKHSDKMLVSALESVFDKKAEYKPYSPEVAKVAEANCKRVLPGNPRIKTVAGNEDAILCEAVYETPKGRSHVLVPVEISANKALLPNAFVSKDGFTRLTEETLANYVVKTAGQKIQADVKQILEIIRTAKHGMAEPISDVEKIVLMANLQGGTPTSYDPNAILQQIVDSKDAPGYELDIPESPEVQSFAKHLSTAAGTAEFVFGANTANAGRKLINQALNGFGYSDFQIKVADVSEDHIIYAVALKNTGFKVPIKIEKSLPTYPTVIMASGQPAEFSKSGIDSLMCIDGTARAAGLGIDLAQPGKLIEKVKLACENKNFIQAGEILNAIAASGDKTAYHHAFSAYYDALAGGKTVSLAVKTIKLSDGNEVCEQTFLPPDKVYIDEHGVAHAKYRQNEEKTEPAGGFMNAKILLGL